MACVENGKVGLYAKAEGNITPPIHVFRLAIGAAYVSFLTNTTAVASSSRSRSVDMSFMSLSSARMISSRVIVCIPPMFLVLCGSVKLYCLTLPVLNCLTPG